MGDAVRLCPPSRHVTLASGSSTSVAFGENRYGSEAGFAPRIGATAEDDGYLVTFVTDMNEDRSECVLYDAGAMASETVCRIMLPHRISSGTHATWAHGEDIRARHEPKRHTATTQ